MAPPLPLAQADQFLVEERERLEQEIERLTQQLATAQANEATTSTIHHVAIKIGPFWKRDPALWFSQLEAQFTLARITAPDTKYHHVVSKIDAEVLECCADLIATPPQHEKYEKIKLRIIKEFTASNKNKTQQLLYGCELGDRKPSQLLRELKRLASGIINDESFIQRLWMQKLPETTQAVLQISEDTVTLDKLAEQADKLSEITPSTSAGIQTINKNDDLDEIKQQIATITKEISALMQQKRNRPPK